MSDEDVTMVKQQVQDVGVKDEEDIKKMAEYLISDTVMIL